MKTPTITSDIQHINPNKFDRFGTSQDVHSWFFWISSSYWVELPFCVSNGSYLTYALGWEERGLKIIPAKINLMDEYKQCQLGEHRGDDNSRACVCVCESVCVSESVWVRMCEWRRVSERGIIIPNNHLGTSMQLVQQSVCECVYYYCGRPLSIKTIEKITTN